MTSEPGSTEFFPFGTHYYCPPTPLPEDWAQDFTVLAEAGYTHVQFRVLWRWYERRRGEFRWDDLDRIFDLAHEHGLRVILKPMLENAPDYVFAELDGVRIGFHGVPLTPFAMNSAYYAGGYMPCFDNPDVLDAAGIYLRRLIERYRQHPALWYYDAWNEPRSRPLAQCHCAHSVASYRAWLRDRFGDIDALNATLHKAWGSYDTLIPPASNADLVEMFLWRQWAAWAVSEQVRFVCDTIRSIDTDTPIAVHSGGCDVARDPACDACDDRLNAQHADRYGFSLNLPYRPSTPKQHNEAEYQSSWLRRVDPEYWCHELYCNSADWCRSTEPLTLGRHVWMAIAAGCSAVTFWEFRSVRMGIRSNGFGMREINGAPTVRSAVCDAIAGVLRDHGARLAQTRREPARVGLLFCKQSDLVQRLTKMHAWMGNLEDQTPDIDYWYKRALRNVHALYRGNGECVDWFVPGDDLGSLSLLHVTSVELVDPATADWLRAFVARGGTLVVEFPFACRDEKTWIHFSRPGHGLDDLLGCTEVSREVTWDDPPDIATFAAGPAIAAKAWRVVLDPTSGAPAAHWPDGRVAAVTNRYGEGKVYAFGVNVSASFTDCWDDPGYDVFRWLLRDAGVADGLAREDRGLRVQRRVGAGHEIQFAFNVSDTPKRVVLPAVGCEVWHMLAAAPVADGAVTLNPGGAVVFETASG